MTRDLYRDLRELCADLEAAGAPLWAERINNAVLAGATGSEIFLALRVELRKPPADEAAIPRSLRFRAAVLRRDIDEALRQSGWT
jgi:hypothetical protein